MSNNTRDKNNTAAPPTIAEIAATFPNRDAIAY
jgi:hypothetical protein